MTLLQSILFIALCGYCAAGLCYCVAAMIVAIKDPDWQRGSKLYKVELLLLCLLIIPGWAFFRFLSELETKRARRLRNKRLEKTNRDDEV